MTGTRKGTIRRTVAVCGVALGCSGTTTRPAVAPVVVAAGRSPSCTVLAPGPTRPDSLVVAVSFSIDATHVPDPANAAERLVFAQSYETLIGVDCEGRAHPGLAQSWTTDATKTRVTLVLRDGARFSNGNPVLARDVVAAWRTTGESPTDAGRLARRLADATTIVDDRTLIVSLPDTASLVLAERALAIYRSGSLWPEGSGPYRFAESTPTMLTMLPANGLSFPRLTIRSRPSADARDGLDAGADLLITADPVAIRYAATRAELATAPLPWTRSYVLAGRSAGGLGLPSGDSAAAFRASLARDAVRAEARAADPSAGCDPRDSTSSASANTGRRPTRIVYRADDHVARDLAERLVAIAGRTTAVPLAPVEFARVLRAGTEPAYIVGVPRPELAPCGAIPLVDTRERAIFNRARASFVIDWDGTLRLIPGRP